MPELYLDNLPVDEASIAERMSWAAGRETTRGEDRAYSLLGLFKVHMPLLYGEGSKAFIRLQEEIMRRSDDDSILCHGHHNILARTPFDFRESGEIVAGPMRAAVEPYEMTNRGLKLHVKARLLPMPHEHTRYKEEIYRIELGCHKLDEKSIARYKRIPQFLYVQRFGHVVLKYQDYPSYLVKNEVRSWGNETTQMFYVTL